MKVTSSLGFEIVVEGKLRSKTEGFGVIVMSREQSNGSASLRLDPSARMGSPDGSVFKTAMLCNNCSSSQNLYRRRSVKLKRLWQHSWVTIPCGSYLEENVGVKFRSITEGFGLGQTVAFTITREMKRGTHVQDVGSPDESVFQAAMSKKCVSRYQEVPTIFISQCNKALGDDKSVVVTIAGLIAGGDHTTTTPETTGLSTDVPLCMDNPLLVKEVLGEIAARMFFTVHLRCCYTPALIERFIKKNRESYGKVELGPLKLRPLWPQVVQQVFLKLVSLQKEICKFKTKKRVVNFGSKLEIYCNRWKVTTGTEDAIENDKRSTPSRVATSIAFKTSAPEQTPNRS
ncbi:unnamed protein product [Thlaspi arvense]|uniref:Uncharacterized protein n=1 Tax=Thlaspi arvense TaxID=13288 RepID=A0AAU9SVB3_THLAR|nr:unnamed protein product [Thlaspi arvense]